jgi:hypothetical protein
MALSRGDRGGCVSELQHRLAAAGAVVAADGLFGSETERSVEAVQTLAELPVTGVADAATRAALASGQVTLRSWDRQRIQRRIIEVFVEDPTRAVAVAQCVSGLEPLLVLHHELHGRPYRSYGVFQLWAPGTIQTLGGTPRQALDPEWNIQAAHRLWARTHDFAIWGCPAPSSPATTGSASRR